MSASNAYQEKIAGRVREDEQIGFFGRNEVAVPGRITSSNAQGGHKNPVIKKNFLQTPNVGKTVNIVPELDVDVEPSYNSAP